MKTYLSCYFLAVVLQQESLNKDTERKSERRRRQSVVTMPFNSSVAGRNGKGESVTSWYVMLGFYSFPRRAQYFVPRINLTNVLACTPF